MTKRIVQAAGITAAAVIGVLISAGTAAADGHSVPDPGVTWPCDIGQCSSSGFAWGAPDGAEVRDASIVPARQELDLSVPVIHHNYPVSTYPKPPKNIPVGTYPILPPSWPGSGFGAVAG